MKSKAFNPKSEEDCIVRNLESGYRYFKKNYETFKFWNEFIFKSSLSDDMRDILARSGRSQIEIPVIAAHIARQRGEFAQQEIGFAVKGNNIDADTIDIVEMIGNAIYDECKANGVPDRVYNDQLSGGMGAMEVSTAWAHDRTCDQIVRIDRINPTLCIFDPMADQVHKGDGQFCAKITPVLQRVLKAQYPKLSELSDSKTFLPYMEFGWQFEDFYHEKVCLVIDYYERRKEKVKIVELENRQTMTVKLFEKKMALYNPLYESMPIVRRERTVLEDVIYFKRLVGGKVIYEQETDYKYLPLVFFDGDSLIENTIKERSQHTRFYGYGSIDAQRLKNLTASVLATSIETVSNGTLVVQEEAIDNYSEQKLQSYKNPAEAAVLLYKGFTNQNGASVANNEPHYLQPPQLPPQVFSLIPQLDEQIQATLGAYDAQLGINGNDVSGKALQIGATNSSMSAMPYANNFKISLAQVGRIVADLIPKRYADEARTVTVKNKSGAQTSVKLTPAQAEQLRVGSRGTVLNVTVTVSTSLESQKQQSLQEISNIAQTIPGAAQVIQNSLDVVFDNFTGRGADRLKQNAIDLMEQAKQAQAQQGQAQQNNPALQIEAMKAQNEAAKIKNAEQALQLKQMELMNKAGEGTAKLKTQQQKNLFDFMNSHASNQVQLQKADAERFSKEIELALKSHGQAHDQTLRELELAHQISSQQREQLHEKDSENPKSDTRKGRQNQEARKRKTVRSLSEISQIL